MQVNHRLYCVAAIPHSLEHSVYTCSVVLSWFISFRLGMRGLVNNNNNLLIGCSITRVVYIEVLITRCILYNNVQV